MNFKQISEQYPKAWGKFMRLPGDGYRIDEDGDLVIGGMPDYDEYPVRNLFDFFDQEGIYINVAYDSEDNFDFAVYDSTTKDTYFLGVEGDSSWATRLECESRAFTKAFSILEERLNK